LKSARDRKDMTAAYREVGTYRGAAAMCGCDPKTIRRALARLKAGDQRTQRKELQRNYDVAAGVVAAPVARTSGRISAKRLLPEARVTAAAPSTLTRRRS
jgi:hypothetical protein